MKVTVIPDIVFNGVVKDFSEIDDQTGERGQREVRQIRLVPQEPMTLNIKDNPQLREYNKFVSIQGNKKKLAEFIGGAYVGGDVYIGNLKLTNEQIRSIALSKIKPLKKEVLYINREIKEKLRDIVKDAVQVGISQDVGALVGNPKSPPLVIDKPEGWEELQSVQDEFIENNVSATFQVVQDGEYLNRLRFAEERVFRVASPLLSSKNTFYTHQNNLGLSCAYEYIVNTFGNVSGFKKLAKNKRSIDQSINNPSDESKLIFDEWTKLYSEEFASSYSDIDALPNYIDTDELSDPMYDLSVVKMENSWSEKDIERSLSVLDLVKWCIASKVRLNVIDHTYNYYLTYNPQMFKNRYIRQPTTKRNITVLVKYNHAYFVEDSVVKQAISLSDTKMNLTFNLFGGVSEKDVPAEQELSQEKCKYILNAGLDFVKPMDEHEKPPPTITELKELMERKELTHYYIDKSNLNGLINLLYKSENIQPDALSGSISTIHRARYKSLKIYSNKDSAPQIREDEEWGLTNYDTLYEEYPSLNSMSGRIPTKTDIAVAVYQKHYEEDNIDYRSMFNSQMRKIFFENEIKPDVRYNPRRDTNPVFSLDFTRAYTTALKTNTFSWNVFDALSQPEKYRNGFKPDYFYICRNLTSEFPLRGKRDSLVLYHGSMIQYIMDKVEIKYFIRPHKRLEPDHFVKFVNACEEFHNVIGDPEGVGDIANSKILVNRFIGNLKQKDGINDYKLWLIDNKDTAVREMMKGRIPCKLKSGTGWGREGLIVGYPKHVHHFQSGQPIRLQVIEMVNSQNYLLYIHYKKCLYAWKFVHNFQNDIKQRKAVAKVRGKAVTKKDFKCDYTPKLMGVKTDALYIQSPIFVNDSCFEYYEYGEKKQRIEWNLKQQERLDKFKNYIQDSWNRLSDWKVKLESQMSIFNFDDCIKDVRGQLPVKFVPNQWDTEIDIRHKWDKDTEGRLYLNTLLNNGGGWISGLGGRGKSELALVFDEMIEYNNKVFNRLKILFKYCFPSDFHERLECWKLRHPVMVKSLAPTNKACNRLNIYKDFDDVTKAKTLNKGLGIPVFDKDEEDEEEEQETDSRMSGEAIESIICRLEGRPTKVKDKFIKRFRTDVCLIDELSMVGGRMLSYLAYIKLRIPTIKFIVMGDLEHQLKPVGEEYRNFVNAFVIKELANFNKLTLHYNFRTGKDKDTLYDLCKYPSYFKDRVGDLTVRNLSYTHKTRQKVIIMCQDKYLVNPYVVKTDENKKGHTKYFKYGLGCPIIARKSCSENGYYNNEMFYISNISVKDETKTIRLWQPDRAEGIYVEEEELVKNFLSGFCITIHKSQSETYKDEYTVWDWSMLSEPSDNNLRLRYTALSRSSDWENKVFIKP